MTNIIKTATEANFDVSKVKTFNGGYRGFTGLSYLSKVAPGLEKVFNQSIEGHPLEAQIKSAMRDFSMKVLLVAESSVDEFLSNVRLKGVNAEFPGSNILACYNTAVRLKNTHLVYAEFHQNPMQGGWITSALIQQEFEGPQQVSYREGLEKVLLHNLRMENYAAGIGDFISAVKEAESSPTVWGLRLKEIRDAYVKEARSLFEKLVLANAPEISTPENTSGDISLEEVTEEAIPDTSDEDVITVKNTKSRVKTKKEA